MKEVDTRGEDAATIADLQMGLHLYLSTRIHRSVDRGPGEQELSRVFWGTGIAAQVNLSEQVALPDVAVWTTRSRNSRRIP
jgi:hypothetical protein